MLRGAGIVALFVLAACGQSSVAPKATPSAPVAQANWNQDINFKGELSGHMSGIVADVGSRTSVCTGAKPRTGQIWADRFYGTIDASGQVWGIIFNLGNYAGPGTYKNGAVAVQVFNPNDSTHVWENLGSDVVTFTLDRSQESGTLDAVLTNADTGKTGAVHVTGHWNCKA